MASLPANNVGLSDRRDYGFRSEKEKEEKYTREKSTKNATGNKTSKKSILGLVARLLGPYEFAMLCETFDIDCRDEDYTEFLEKQKLPTTRIAFIDPDNPDEEMVAEVMRLLKQFKYHLTKNQLVVMSEIFLKMSLGAKRPKRRRKNEFLLAHPFLQIFDPLHFTLGQSITKSSSGRYTNTSGM